MKKILSMLFLTVFCLAAVVPQAQANCEGKLCKHKDKAGQQACSKENGKEKCHKEKSDKEKCGQSLCHARAANPQFTQLKQLVGTWTGSAVMNGQKKMVRVDYTLTAGGTALVETLFPGTKEEMVSIFTSTGKSVKMTHYCMMGNQPQLVLDSSSNNSWHFKYVKTPGINARKDHYMGGVRMTLQDAKHLTQEWVGMTKGKESMKTVFTLVRK